VRVLLLLLLASTAHAEGIRYQPVETELFRAHVFRIDLSVAQVELRPAAAGARQTVRMLVPDAGDLVAVNASYFDPADRAMGITAGRGKVIPSWSALVIAGGRARLVEGRRLTAVDRADAILQGTPRLLVDGVVQRLKPQVARRTAVCAEGSTLIVVVTTRADATALAELLRDRLHCKNALNLDGGPSTQLEAHLPGVQITEPGQPVPNALIIR
jgi:exopolysaccharide biosynthesis protein